MESTDSVIIRSTEAIKVDNLGEVFGFRVVLQQLRDAIHIVHDTPARLTQTDHPIGLVILRVWSEKTPRRPRLD